MKITEYNLISLSDINQVVEQANKLISEGWQPFGSISITYEGDKGKPLFVQTLVKYKN